MNDTYNTRPFDHGGRAREGQTDFSANISPLGVPDAVRAVLADLAAGDELARYPDPDCSELCAAIAAREGVPAERVLCGNGAADLIYRYAAAVKPERALVLQPTFSEYEKALALTGCETEQVLLRPENGFAWTEDLLTRLTPDLDLFVFCSPNNPTGVSAPPDLLVTVLDRCEEQGIAVLWDASFLDFAETPEVYRGVMQKAWQKAQDLSVLNSFTKLYALAGLRLGYLLTPEGDRSAAMQAAGAPWTVSTAAQKAGVAALGCEDYADELRRYIATEKQFLTDGLEALGFRVLPADGDRAYVLPDANFFLLRTEREDLADTLEEHCDIVLRRAETFPGLDAHFVRIAVRTHDENTNLLNALKEVLTHG